MELIEEVSQQCVKNLKYNIMNVYRGDQKYIYFFYYFIVVKGKNTENFKNRWKYYSSRFEIFEIISFCLTSYSVEIFYLFDPRDSLLGSGQATLRAIPLGIHYSQKSNCFYLVEIPNAYSFPIQYMRAYDS